MKEEAQMQEPDDSGEYCEILSSRYNIVIALRKITVVDATFGRDALS